MCKEKIENKVQQLSFVSCAVCEDEKRRKTSKYDDFCYFIYLTFFTLISSTFASITNDRASYF